jgi:CheY-like chemotaxis protein
MLGVIVANAEIGLLGCGAGGSLERFEEIKKAALRSAELTRQLLAFARKQTVSPKVISLNDAIPGMLQMLARLIGENITLDYAQRAGLWNIRIDPVQVDQILANLAVNARDAINGVGSMTIRTSNLELREEDCAGARHRRPGQYVLLEVGDTGCGMDDERLEHIFEPFFTTKGVGKGTGLGLATVYGIVKQNSGFIEVSSRIGEGTTFRVHLPRSEGGVEELAAASSAASSLGTLEKILVVEDERMNLEVTGMLLETLGYEVLATSSPSEALRILEAEGQGVRMLLTDIIMPEMNGRELAERAQALRPGLGCLFMSGYTDDVIARHGVLPEEVKLLEKPFTLESLAGRIREVLDATGRG